MECKSIIKDYLNEKNIDIGTEYTGVILNCSENEIVIKGKKIDLIELADLILSVALDKSDNHLHIDDLTLISKESVINNLIIEKKEN